MSDLRESTDLDYGLMANYFERGAVPMPPLTDLGAPPKGDWCGYCGYTGHVLGPKQAACPERHGWHRWLERNVDLHSPWPTYEQRKAVLAGGGGEKAQ